MIQLGKQTTRCALLAVAALGVSGNALAQTPPPAPAPGEPAPTTPEPAPQPTTTDQPPPAAPAPPVPGPPPAGEQQPLPVPAPPPPPALPAMAGPALRLSDLFTFRPGFLLQLWGNFTQDSLKQTNGDSGQFTKNFYIRRVRLLMGGSIGSNITYFLQTESSNNGLATVTAADGTVSKNSTLFQFVDAFADYKFNPFVSVQAGLMLVPFTRNILQSTASYWTLDIAGVSASYLAATQTNQLRDTGLQVKLNALENHFELRGMVSEGVRQADLALAPGATTPPALTAPRGTGKNDPRLTAFAQYNFFDGDAGYVFNGQYFGRKRILAIAAGADYQSIADNPYFATSATVAAAIPVHGAPNPKDGDDEFGGQVEYLHFHGGGAALSSGAAGLSKFDALLVELGYYNKAAKISVFGQFQGRFFPDAGKVNNQRIFAGGLKYFIAEQVANLTLQYSLTQTPDQTDLFKQSHNDVNSIILALQLAYF